MGLRVAGDGDVFVIAGEVAAGQRDDVAVVNRFLAHLKGRNFARATRRAYAFDVLNFLRFLAEPGVGLAEVRPTDLFDYLDWQSQPKRTASWTVVRLCERRGAAPATQNRRIAAVRALFEFAVITGVVMASPVPAPRRTSGLRARRGLLGHIPARHPRSGGRLVREQRLLNRPGMSGDSTSWEGWSRVSEFVEEVPAGVAGAGSADGRRDPRSA
ncbi:hypothetical protein MHEC_27810 [Mycobacterium heckeshornense]|uniref:Core-binding (CB) domain-containing protein n=2 Tax=Mycobacterium heckeshornense TaxID=110505 RepID=A0A7R7JI88_9MYCO|nr:hypothetical protein MHEC_27810 [Mycobacterium heckeshornense]